jgi:hypothetical protein
VEHGFYFTDAKTKVCADLLDRVQIPVAAEKDLPFRSWQIGDKAIECF